MKTLALAILSAAAVTFAPAAAAAATYEVGPGKPFASIQDTLGMLAPGDTVEVQGGQTYPGDLWIRVAGARGNPITFKGIAVNGQRPIIQGVGTAQYHDIVVLFYANHLVFDGFEIIGDSDPTHTGVVNKADDVLMHDCVVHGSAGQGLLGTDSESGSFTLDSCEFYGNGSDLYTHQIYMATDETMYPGSVFRMQYCYVHDGNGGNNVKSRSERNEIYYNWIEAAVYHELDLIGPDGQAMSLAREDSDVVGNVLVKKSEWRIARIGGDDTGNTAGRYRFVNNTMILSATSDVAIGLQQSVESVEMHNNVILRVGAAGGSVSDYNEPSGPAPQFFGSNNWIQTGIGDIPASFTGTLSGADPGFADAANSDYRPAAGSPLIDAGTTATADASLELTNPLLLPAMVPPSRALGTQGPRPDDGKPDVGAFELGSGTDPGQGGSGIVGPGAGGGSPSGSGGGSPSGSGAGPSSGPGGPSTGTGNSGGGHGTGGSNAGSGGRTTASGGVGGDGDAPAATDGGCGCRTAPSGNLGAAGWAALALASIAAAASRRRRAPR